LKASIINAYLLYVESCKNSNSNPISHIKFRREPVMALVGDFRQGGGVSTRGRTSTCDNQQRLNGMLHVIIQRKNTKIAQRAPNEMCQVEGRKQRTFVKHVIVIQIFTWERVSKDITH
jgi:hypothetical protein